MKNVKSEFKEYIEAVLSINNKREILTKPQST